MHTTGPISLSPQDVLSMKGVREGMDRKAFGRIKALCEGGCIPFHVPSSQPGRDPTVVFTTSSAAPMLGPSIQLRGGEDEIARVVSAGRMGPDLSLLLKRDFRIADKDMLTFRDAALARAFEVETIAIPFGTSERMIYLSEGKAMSPIGSALLRPADLIPGIWAAWPEILRRIAGIGGTACYSGSMMGIEGNPGRITVAGLLKSEETPAGSHGFAWTMESVAGLISGMRDVMDHRLRCALVMAGYREWGTDFLKKADR